MSTRGRHTRPNYFGSFLLTIGMTALVVVLLFR